MSISFLILAHKNFKQTCLLIESLLKYPLSKVILHVDAKSETLQLDLLSNYQSNSRVVILNKRYDVTWGSYNQILATLSLMQEACVQLCDYQCLISAQDLPIKPLSALADFLNKNKGQEFLEYNTLPISNWDYDGGLERLNLFWLNKPAPNKYFANKVATLIYLIQIKTGFKRNIKYPLYGGSNWFMLSGDAIHYICHFIETHPDFLKMFKYSRCADEIFVQTILLNSSFKNKVVSKNYRFIDWSSGPEYPRIFRYSDEAALKQNVDCFFARKFDEEVDNVIIKKIIENLES